MQCLSPQNWLSKLKSDDKVLLVNPPVQEVRYAWLKWNQPSDLLLLSSRLKQEIGCEVELLDFMLPTDSGRVPVRDLARAKDVYGTVYKTRTYGMSILEAREKLTALSPDWTPTHIVITSLTTYWYEAIVTTLIPNLKTIFPSMEISLMGSYPKYETEHAMRTNADYLITDFFDFNGVIPDYSIYYQKKTRRLHDDRTLLFCGLNFSSLKNTPAVIKEIKKLRKLNVRDFVLFENDLFVDGCIPLNNFLSVIEQSEVSINLHALCGLNIDNAVNGIYSRMLKSGFRSFYLEYTKQGQELDLDSYIRAYMELIKNNNVQKIPSGSMAGFLMIGTHDDDLERLFKHSFQILEVCGSIIPKPYTPNVGSMAYKKISSKRLDFLSPHVFPLADENGIKRSEYMEFYQHTSFLNEKRLGSSFNFFDDHYCSIALRRSLGKKGG